MLVIKKKRNKIKDNISIKIKQVKNKRKMFFISSEKLSQLNI